MKKICCVLACLLLFAGVSVSAKPKMPQPTDRFFVNDFADLIPAEMEEEIYLAGRELYEKTGAQVVAVTVETVGPDDIRSYAYQLATQWGIGSEEEDNGVLLLLSIGDREIDIDVGYGLEGALPDGKCGRILDHYAMPYLQNGDYGGGVAAAYDALINEVYIEYGLEPDENYVPVDDAEDELTTSEGFGVLAFVLIFLLLTISSRGRRFLLFSFGGSRGSGFHSSGFSSRGGGFGGGGGFSGGGGSFGGGGASRGF